MLVLVVIPVLPLHPVVVVAVVVYGARLASGLDLDQLGPSSYELALDVNAVELGLLDERKHSETDAFNHRHPFLLHQ